MGKLIYLTITHPDLAYSVHVLAQFMNSPHSVYWHAALKLIKYLKNTATQGLMYATKVNPVLAAFCDADWEAVIELDSRCQVFVLLLDLLLCLGVVKSKQLCLTPLLKPNTAVWLMFVVR